MKQFTTFLLCSVLLYASCKQHQGKDTAAKGKISMPDHVEVYNPYMGKDLNDPLKSNAPLRIYTLIDVSCSPCFLKLEKWDKLQAEIKAIKPVAIIPVCYSKDNFELIRFLFETDKITRNQLPLVFDLDNKFRQQNPTLVNKLGQLTALTDEKNNVLLIGDPLDDKNDKEKFLKMIAAR
jgi:hypothetical protein